MQMLSLASTHITCKQNKGTIPVSIWSQEENPCTAIYKVALRVDQTFCFTLSFINEQINYDESFTSHMNLPLGNIIQLELILD